MYKLLLTKRTKTDALQKNVHISVKKAAKKHLCKVLGMLCGCSANMLYVLGANIYFLFQNIQSRELGHPSRGALLDPCREGI